MTGSQVKGRSFRGALRYSPEKVATGKVEVLDNSFVNVTERNIMKEVAMVRMQRPDLKKYFYHTSINFPKEENVSNELTIKIGRDYLEANGFNQHQYIIFVTRMPLVRTFIFSSIGLVMMDRSSVTARTMRAVKRSCVTLKRNTISRRWYPVSKHKNAP